jgi:hypothetical protein
VVTISFNFGSPISKIDMIAGVRAKVIGIIHIRLLLSIIEEKIK